MDKHRPLGYQQGKKNILDLKAPTNPKYQSIEGKLKTGRTVRDVEYKSDRYISKLKLESFKRVKCKWVMELLSIDRNQESIYSLNKEQKQHNILNDDCISETSELSNCTFNSEKSGISALTQQSQMLGFNNDTTFIILDIRIPEQYEQFQIRESINFPAQQAVKDKFTNEILRMKNAPNKYIIICGNDEKEGIPVANHFFEKGFDNAFLISGGIEKFLIEYPQFIQGNVPEALLKQINSQKKNKDKLQGKENTTQQKQETMKEGDKMPEGSFLKKKTQSNLGESNKSQKIWH